jgi:Family of unknown function (DUF5989)
MNPAFVEKVNQKRKARSSWTARVTSPLQTLLEFNQLAIKSGRGWWLIPMMGMLILLGILLVFIQVIEYVAPFVYTIF